MSLRKNFGKNLGFSNIKYIKQYGHNWQFYLARDIVRAKETPWLSKIGEGAIYGERMYREAKMYLHSVPTFRERPVKNDGKYPIDNYYKFTTYQHYREDHHFRENTNTTEYKISRTFEDQLYNDPYWWKIMHGSRKLVNPMMQDSIDRLKQQIKNTSNRAEKRMLKEKLRDMIREARREPWKEAYLKDKFTFVNRIDKKGEQEAVKRINETLDTVLDLHLQIEMGADVSGWINKLNKSLDAALDGNSLAVGIAEVEDLEDYVRLLMAILNGRFEPSESLKKNLRYNAKWHRTIQLMGATELYAEYNVPTNPIYKAAPNKYYRQNIKAGKFGKWADPGKKQRMESKPMPPTPKGK